MIACRVPASMSRAVMIGAVIFGAVVLCGRPGCGPVRRDIRRRSAAAPAQRRSEPPPQPQPQPPPQAAPPQPFNQGTLLPPGPPPGRPGGVQTEDLPPPPGATLAPPGPVPAALPRPAGAPPPGQALPSGPGQRPQPGKPNQPGAAAPPPEDVVTQPPTQKIVNPKAVFSGLDKITGRITTFDAAIGETVQFGALQVTPRACYTRPPTETPLTDGFVEVDEVTLQGEVRRIFTGWMFAASPGLHGVEHAIYDVWLTDCKGGAQAVAEAPPPPPPPVAAPAARPPAQPARAGAGAHDPAAAPAPDRRRAAAAADPLRPANTHRRDGYLSPRAGRGRRASCAPGEGAPARIAVRGLSAGSDSRKRPLHPDPLPARGAREQRRRAE